ncbi:hypothetical protein N7462_004685 [Penicillium macrosclerotiorum]|uniref:uncharacterized protein n=1 Tax=Penicillium macrosclerotiorum TaxID=303699 RepID=UPI0025497E22|nr:uncharacterized protein N7462_004685 [Penicillium macrosclerotiorum]KAJ5690293.1 hypothetical protein N7462_004685 [Penicillium macrosclerotiorum]
MVPARIPQGTDEELGKKDDDHRFPDHPRFRPIHPSRIPRPRRLLFIILILFAVYQFFKHMPTDLTPAAERYNPKIASLKHQNPISSPPGPNQSPPRPKVESSLMSDGKDHEMITEVNYDGKIKFYELAQSLPHREHDANTASRAVVFAASSLHSVSDMLPLACKMATKQLNHVHFVLMGKDEVSIRGIKQVNGIYDSDCPITWHDSRPDRAPESSHARMERSVAGGLEILQSYILPEVIITQSQEWENSFFWNGVNAHKWKFGTPHIALPTASINVMWIALVDSTALQVWNDIKVDIVVHASESFSSLIRLIRSLDAADYLGSTPSLTIELPQSVDLELLRALQDLKGLSQLAGQITLRHRIQPHFVDPAESSLRTVESFYPLNPKVSHLLLLSPQTELASSFYHYLKYSILFYKQSARAQRDTSKLLGISLELPSVKPTSDYEQFDPPSLQASDEARPSGKEFVPTFLWQSPNSNAALYFGDKWAEFHSFLSSRFGHSEVITNIPSQEKLISKKYPAFLEYLLEMIRAKGYYMVYPSFPGRMAVSLATVHSDIYHLPEEFAHGESPNKLDDASIEEINSADQPLQPPPTAFEALSAERPTSHASTIMSLLDSFELGFQDVDTLPLVSYSGEHLSAETLDKQTKEYAKEFRVRYGRCSDEAESVNGPSANLFCHSE